MNEFTIEIIRIIGPLLWALPVLLAYFWYQNRRDRERFEMERYLKREELEREEYLKHKLSRDIERDDRYTPKLQEELFYRLDRLEKRLSKASIDAYDTELSSRLDSILNAVSQSKELPEGTPENIVRELSHSLNTPLSQIEVAASIAITSKEQGEDIEKSIRSIIDSVQVCKAFLGAFRELVVSGSAAVWNPSSISDTVNSAGQIYIASQNKPITLKIKLPSNVDGYSNNYVTSLILPLLENAVESSKEHTIIEVAFSDIDNRNIVRIINEPEALPGGNEIYAQGYTTKKDHEGTGLTSVKHLLSAYQGASLEHSHDSKMVTFTISLPGRVK